MIFLCYLMFGYDAINFTFMMHHILSTNKRKYSAWIEISRSFLLELQWVVLIITLLRLFGKVKLYSNILSDILSKLSDNINNIDNIWKYKMNNLLLRYSMQYEKLNFQPYLYENIGIKSYYSSCCYFNRRIKGEVGREIKREWEREKSEIMFKLENIVLDILRAL